MHNLAADSIYPGGDFRFNCHLYFDSFCAFSMEDKKTNPLGFVRPARYRKMYDSELHVEDEQFPLTNRLSWRSI